jgi:hypothetical protein
LKSTNTKKLVPEQCKFFFNIKVDFDWFYLSGENYEQKGPVTYNELKVIIKN